MSQATVARELGDNEGIADDGELIDFRTGRARLVLRAALSDLADMLSSLNARPGAGINFAMIYEIGRAERRVADAQSALNRLKVSASR